MLFYVQRDQNPDNAEAISYANKLDKGRIFDEQKSNDSKAFIKLNSAGIGQNSNNINLGMTIRAYI